MKKELYENIQKNWNSFGSLNEKKELDQKTIDAVAKMTDSNAHNYARMELAQALRNKRLENAYRAMETLTDYFNGLEPGMDKMRSKLDAHLKGQLENKFSNAKDIWGAL